MNKRIQVSIINWNSADYVINCVSELKELPRPSDVSLHITVLDNASQPGSVAEIRKKHPNLDIIESSENLGFAGGHNLVYVQRHDADIFWVLNSDIQFRQNTLLALWNAYEDCGLGVYGSITFERDSPDVLKIDSLHLPRSLNINTKVHCFPMGSLFSDVFPDSKPKRVNNIIGFSMFIPIEIINKYGFMNDEYFMYVEEIDFCLRLSQVGVPIYYVPDSIMDHQIRGTYQHIEEIRWMMDYYLTRNKLVRIRRFDGYWAFLAELRKYIKRWHFGKFLIRKYIPFIGSPPINERYYQCLGIRDALLNRLGRTFNPNDYFDKQKS